MILHGYWRSSAAYRVRIALNFKGIEWTHREVSLIRKGGEHQRPDFAELNPQKLVPVLESGSTVLTQSVSIIEYLEEILPHPPLLPAGAVERARVRALAMAIACDVHPLNNLRVLEYLGGELGIDTDRRTSWYSHWVTEGMQAIETLVSGSSKTCDFCHGDSPTLADVCLVPQLYNARRYEIDLTPYPSIRHIESNCLRLKAFVDAQPENQRDAE